MQRVPAPSRNQSSREFHVVLFGAGGVGKSCITAQFVHNEWIESYDPTIEDTYRAHIQVDGRAVLLEILDTAGTEQFVAMRDVYTRIGDGFLLVFSITSQSSFEELEGLREEIIRMKDDDERFPIVLVGNKCDLEHQREVNRADAFAAAQEWDCPYYESSARTRTNIEEVFTDICRQMIKASSRSGDTSGGSILVNKKDGGDGNGSLTHSSPFQRLRKKARGRESKSTRSCTIL